MSNEAIRVPSVATQIDASEALREIWPRWQGLLWMKGMRPMHQKMVAMNHTMSEQVILRRLHHQTMRVHEVAEELAISPSAASRAVDRLVRDGLVTRHESTEDRRQRVLSLTPHGERLMRDIEQEFGENLLVVVQGLSEVEQATFLRLLQRMIEAYEARHDTVDTP